MQIAPFEGISCAPREFYEEGGFYEQRYRLGRLQEISEPWRAMFAVQGEIVPASDVRRQVPSRMWGPDSRECDQTLVDFTRLDREFAFAPAALLVKISRPSLWNDVLCVPAGAEFLPVYETYRRSDIPLKGVGAGPRMQAMPAVSMDREKDYIFISSVGAFNYGHWLVDDLPRVLASAAFINGLANPCLLLTAHNEEMDALRWDFLRGHFSPRVTVEFVDQAKRFDFDSIYFVTPVSLHPIVKNPLALQLVANLVDKNVASGDGAKLFVNRGPRWPRQILNIDEIRAVLADQGYLEIFPETMSFAEQRELFRRASHICGIMGSAMTNAIFAPPSAKVLHLAPQGWREPFFWDLSDCVGQRDYSTVFGAPLNNGAPLYQQSFTLQSSLLAAALSDDDNRKTGEA